MPAETEHPWATKRKCPDGGGCTHACGPEDLHGCWRVSFCVPLSAHGEDWTDEEKAANTNPPTRIESFIVGEGDDG